MRRELTDIVFGHIEKKTVIPIGIKAHINTSEDEKIKLIENCVK